MKNADNTFRALTRWGWRLIALAGLIMLITMGVRQTMSLFVEPLLQNTNLNIVSISFALACNQLLWGVFQPLMGAWADRKGPLLVLSAGSLILMAGQLAVIWVDAAWSVLLVWGVLAPMGAAAGGFSILMGLTAHLPAHKRPMASAIISSGASLGQFLFAPLVQFFIATWGYVSALVMLAGFSLANLPLAVKLCHLSQSPPPLETGQVTANIYSASSDASLKNRLLSALSLPGFWFLNAGFFLGGFHVGFVITHLPAEASAWNISGEAAAWSLGLIGLCNVAGTLLIGFLGNRFASQHILGTIYLSRALLVALYLLAPKTGPFFCAFAALLGLNWLATVPPTAGLVGRLCGMRYFATLFGISLLAHQSGAFLGALGGGALMTQTGSYALMWWLSIASSLAAALLSWLVKNGRHEALPPDPPVA